MRSISIIYLIVIGFVISPSVVWAEDVSNLSVLQKEYQQLKNEVDIMSLFIIQAADERAPFKTLVDFSNTIIIIEEEIDELEKAVNNLKLKSDALAINRVWITNAAKKTDAFTQIGKGDTAYLYLSFNMPTDLASLNIELTLSEKSSGNEIANIQRDRSRKGNAVFQKTGIAVNPERLAEGKAYIFSATIITPQGERITNKETFTYGGPSTKLADIKLSVTDDAGKAIKTTVDNESTLHFQATVPHAKQGSGEVVWKLFDDAGEFIEGSEKREEISESGTSSTLKYGFATQNLPLGRYNVVVTHALQGTSSDEVKSSFAFEVIGSLAIHKLSVSNSKKGNVENGVLYVGDKPHLYIHYTAKRPAKWASVNIYDPITKQQFYTGDITDRIKPDATKHRIGIALKKDTIDFDKDTIFE